MSNPLTELEKDDLYFRMAVDTLGGSLSPESAGRLLNRMRRLLNTREDDGKALEWIRRFYYTVWRDPDRYRKADQSRCSVCRWSALCPPVNRTNHLCTAFLSCLVKEHSIFVTVGGSDKNYSCLPRMAYEGGLAHGVTETAVQMPWKTFIRKVQEVLAEACVITFRNGVENGFLQYGVRPRRNETLPEYRARVQAMHDKALDDLAEKESPGATEEERLENALRGFIDRLGQGLVLREEYGGDVLRMVEDWWPGMDPAAMADDTGRRPDKNLVLKKIWETLYKERKERTSDERE